jgi:hypothetical protein
MLTCIWAYFRLPETKNRTYEELDILFSKKVPARKFATTDVSTYDEASEHILADDDGSDLSTTDEQQQQQNGAYSSLRNSGEAESSGR